MADSSLQLVALDTQPTPSSVDGSDPVIDYDENWSYASNGVQELKNAIRKDDAAEMLRILKTMDIALLNEVLHRNEEVIDKRFGVWHCDDALKQLQGTRPLFLCIVYQSKECLRALLETGKINVHIQDRRGNNMVHLLCYLSKANPTVGVAEMYAVIMDEIKEKIHRRRLLLHRSYDGLNPLELASKLNCAPIFNSILSTDGAYREVLDELGGINRNSYSFLGSPSGRSFLWQMTWCANSDESLKSASTIVRIPAVSYLIQKKFKRWLPLIFLWFLMRYIYIMLYIMYTVWVIDLYDAHICAANKTLKNTDTFSKWWSTKRTGGIEDLSVVIIVYSGLYCYSSMLLDVIEFIYVWKTLKINRQYFKNNCGRSFLVNTNFYRIASFICVVLMCVHLHAAYIPLLSDNSDSSKLVLSSVLYAIIMICMLFNILYFLQLIQTFSIGAFVIGAQRLLLSLCRFAALQLAVMVCFSAIFTYVKQFLCRPGNWMCTEDWTSFYSTFLLMFSCGGIVPKTGECSGPGETILKLLHFLYFFVVVILTIAYFVGHVCKKVSHSCEHTSAVVTLHRLHIVLVIERRVEMFRRFVNYIKKGTWEIKGEQTVVVWEVCDNK